RGLFDLGVKPAAVTAQLGSDPILADAVRRLPGLRSPGTFDGFELAVRAILGQQVSVRAATTLARRWAESFGEPLATPYAGLNRLTPAAARIAAASSAEIAALGIVATRARAIVHLAALVSSGELPLCDATRNDASIEALRR